MKKSAEVINIFDPIDHYHPVDRHVGGKVRGRRKHLGLSQGALADAIHLTFQQVQKYERGSNRISASKLFEIAQFLKAPISYFFDGVGDGPSGERPLSASESNAHSFLLTADGIELAHAFPRLKTTKVRRRVLELVRSLAEE